MLVKRYKFSYNNYMNNVELKLNMIAKEMDHLWNGMFIVGGGASALVISEPCVLKIVISIIGFLLAILFLNAYLTKRIIINRFINETRNIHGNNIY